MKSEWGAEWVMWLREKSSERVRKGQSESLNEWINDERKSVNEWNKLVRETKCLMRVSEWVSE